MEDGHGEGTPDLRGRIARVCVRLVLPLAVLATVIAVFFGEEMGIDHELQLIAPASATPGGELPIRAIVLGSLGAPEGPELVSASVDVRLIAPDGAVLSRHTLEPSVAGGADGWISIPRGAPTRLTLRAVARVDREGVASARTTVEVGETRSAPRVGRLAHAMQHFEASPVAVPEGQIPPTPFEPRVVGGACVPEARCDVLVHVGEPAAAIGLESSGQATVLATAAEETSGLVRVSLVAHGPEAHVVLLASRGGVVVARRGLRLPIALATPSMTLAERNPSAPASPEVEIAVVGEPPGVIVDAFQGGVWTRTGAMRPTETATAAPVGALGAGLWRLQAHTDPFATGRCAIRYLLVGRSLEAARPEIEALGGEASPPPPGPPELQLAWALAPLEVGPRQLPRPARGHEEDLARLQSRRQILRMAAIGAMLLGLIVLVVVFLRRGIDAALTAQRVMEATGDPELASARHRRRTLLSALSIVATVLLAFLAAAAMIVARAQLLE